MYAVCTHTGNQRINRLLNTSNANKSTIRSSNPHSQREKILQAEMVAAGFLDYM
jgi:hypothetical protein